ncbi:MULTISPECIES: single-stranded DNA-binding protein [unclassified Curtobacterium]|uniref:single-stranded DNA-binding protein n=1 Tax=unclassified Curtobacterium TaxID=257496 RepID=UPI0037F68D6D
MNDTITVCGIVATEPRHLVTETGIAITSMRLASPSRRWDRANSTWTNGPTNWFTVTAFRSLAANVHKSLKKGDRIIVTGRVRIRTWERDGRGGTSIEIDAEGLGHDLAWGISNWIRVPRHTSEASAAPGSGPRVNPSTGEVEGSDSGPDDMADGAMASGAMAGDDMAGDVPGDDVPGGDARADGEPHHDELPEAAAAAAATAALHRDDAHAGSVPPADLHAA